jgi:hypothetical protein
MAHLEMLIAKGEIRGPPYTMSDDQEFTFLRKFIERQAAGVPHNPRLRGLPQDNRVQPSHPLELPRSETPEDSKNLTSFHDDGTRLLGNVSLYRVSAILFLDANCQRMKNIMLLPLHPVWPRKPR